jgi:hypothetical protein
VVWGTLSLFEDLGAQLRRMLHKREAAVREVAATHENPDANTHAGADPDA